MQTAALCAVHKLCIRDRTAAEGIGTDTSNIAESAGSAASSLKGTTEDLKYMRDIAEQEAIKMCIRDRFNALLASLRAAGILANA